MFGDMSSYGYSNIVSPDNNSMQIGEATTPKTL